MPSAPAVGLSPLSKQGSGPRLYQENWFALAAIVLAFLCWPLGAVFGHVARRRARYTGGAGAGLAVVALMICYPMGFATILLVVIHLGGGGPSYAN